MDWDDDEDQQELRNPDQLELFGDPMQERMDRLIEALLNPSPAFLRAAEYMERWQAKQQAQATGRKRTKHFKTAASRGRSAEALHQRFQGPAQQRYTA